jgi:hypothetical protein
VVHLVPRGTALSMDSGSVWARALWCAGQGMQHGSRRTAGPVVRMVEVLRRCTRRLAVARHGRMHAPGRQRWVSVFNDGRNVPLIRCCLLDVRSLEQRSPAVMVSLSVPPPRVGVRGAARCCTVAH